MQLTKKPAIKSLLILLIAWQGGAIADDPMVTAAQFIQDGQLIGREIKFPDSGDKDLSIAIFCEAKIRQRNGMELYGCLGEGASWSSFSSAVIRAADKANVVSATLNGRQKNVLVHFSVLFTRRGSQEQIDVFPNWGHNVSEFGPNYNAPQRFSDGRTPYSCKSKFFGLVATNTVRSSGKAKSDVIFLDLRSEPSDQCKVDLEKAIVASTYIPGSLKEKPIDATYAESWGSYDYFSGQ